jgi:hypothetical protein
MRHVCISLREEQIEIDTVYCKRVRSIAVTGILRTHFAAYITLSVGSLTSSSSHNIFFQTPQPSNIMSEEDSDLSGDDICASRK